MQHPLISMGIQYINCLAVNLGCAKTKVEPEMMPCALARLEILHKPLKTDPLDIFQTNQSCAHSPVPQLLLSSFLPSAHLFPLFQTTAEFISWYLHQSIPYGAGGGELFVSLVA